MSSTISVLGSSKITVVETFSNGIASDSTASFGPVNEEDTYTASTSVPVTKHAPFNQAMTSGGATLDLTALPGKTVDESVDLTGLKVQLVKLRNKSTNANKITIAKGGSSGYGLAASGDSWSIVLSPGQSVEFFLDEAAPDVDSSHKTIDITGTLAQVLECHIVGG